MPDTIILVVLFAIGAMALVAEVFIPSHGILTVLGVSFLGIAVYRTFDTIGRDAGVVSLVACGISIPTFLYVAIKYWRQTWIGKRIAPPNPTARREDSSVPVAQISGLIGQVGRSVSPLRPVGICDFDGQRISCVCQFGVIEAGVEVEGVGMSGGNLAVAPRKTA